MFKNENLNMLYIIFARIKTTVHLASIVNSRLMQRLQPFVAIELACLSLLPFFIVLCATCMKIWIDQKSRCPAVDSLSDLTFFSILGITNTFSAL